MGKKPIDIVEIISMIRESQSSRSKVIKLLYHDLHLKSGIQKFIYNKGGNGEDVEDIFQSTLIQFVKTVTNKEDFELKTSLNQYMFGIAKNLWFRRLSDKRKNRTENIEDIVLEEKSADTPEDLFLNEERRELLLMILEKTGEKCKKVLMLWASGYRMREIAVNMGYKSEMMARKKKCLCLKDLLIFMENNPEISKQLR